MLNITLIFKRGATVQLRDLTNELLTKIAESEMVADMYRKAIDTPSMPYKTLNKHRLLEASKLLIGPRGEMPTLQDYARTGYNSFVESFKPDSEKNRLGSLAGSLLAQSLGDAGRTLDPTTYRIAGSAAIGVDDVIKKYSPTYKQLELSLKADNRRATNTSINRRYQPVPLPTATSKSTAGRNVWDKLNNQRKNRLPSIKLK